GPCRRCYSATYERRRRSRGQTATTGGRNTDYWWPGTPPYENPAHDRRHDASLRQPRPRATAPGAMPPTETPCAAAPPMPPRPLRFPHATGTHAPGRLPAID